MALVIVMSYYTVLYEENKKGELNLELNYK
jgi:hypothetical protein